MAHRDAGPRLGTNGPPKYKTPLTPAAVKNILYAQPFTVERPFINTWSRDRQKSSAGVLIVVEVDPAYVDPRDAVVTPVLYADNSAVIRLNRGNESGRAIGIVPENVDLASVPIWFGSPELPERLTPAIVQEERVREERPGFVHSARRRSPAFDASLFGLRTSRRYCAMWRRSSSTTSRRRKRN